MHPGTFAEITPDKPAVVMHGSGVSLSYADLDRLSLQVGHLLRACSVGVGGHLAFQVHNSPEFFELLWGAHRCGVIYTAISTRLGVDETAYIVRDCGATVVAVSADLHDGLSQLTDAVADVPYRFAVGVDGPAEWALWAGSVAAQPAVPLESPAGDDMLYSSGTTGRPKGIARDLNGATVDQPDGVTRLCQVMFGFDQTIRYLSPAPLYHAAPLRFTRAVHRVGGTVVQMEHFDPEEFLAAVEQHGITHTQMVPTMFVRLLKLPEEVRNRYDVSSLRAVIHAAAPCPVPVKKQMIDWWGEIIWEYYAGTEGNGLVLASSSDWLAHPGTVGRPLTGSVHIVGEGGEELPPGSTGTVYFDGGGGFRYHNDPEKTADAHDARGWSTIGDIGYVDTEGWLYLTDRKAYMIISGGVNIYPQEAENILVLHPKVADVAVVGAPNDEMGEEVKAVVQPVDWDDAGPELEAELLAYCRDRLAHFKCPRTVDFDQALPRHPTGKLYKRLVQDRYWQGTARISQG
ncbi:MAG: long-chain acyl-CoA synthetase [Acidimicrobiaceae bacterium]|jgi:acyl-CoA synthetase (AMP-forming)/AMP-acid ligase II|nr:long-chain acyl-CoA synthetase [Acidimicrobiaceae bacterium]